MNTCDICQCLLLENFRSDDSGDYCFQCYEKICVERALSAGIPLSVIKGHTKLTDRFSQEYIDLKCNRIKDEY